MDVEARTLLQEWSGPPFDPSLARDELLHELFEARVDRDAEAPAICCGEMTLSYGELEARANALAAHLRSLGVGVGALVGMWLPRGIDTFVAMLAILKAGAGYVPLDADYPAERVAWILDDAECRALLTTTAQSAALEPGARPVIALDTLGELPAAPRLTRAETGAGPSDVAYVIFTSGSTGRPKGCAIEHRNVCNLVRAEGLLFGVRTSDRVFQGFSVAFDASVEETWLAFFAGAVLVVGTAEVVRSGPLLPDFLTRHGVTVLSCVPTLLQTVTEDIPGLWLLILGGERCPDELVRRWARPGRRVVNTYGPTEATVIATWGDCEAGRSVTIGRPAPNYRVYILDEALQPVPVGAGGELCIGGLGVARGYVNRDELTLEKFVPNPFVPGERLYRSGDLAAWTPDGEIAILGRIDSQVKLRGFRVELTEIEAVLVERAEILNAAVAVREDTPGVQQLVGYVIPRDGLAFDEDEVRAWLRTRLPIYMVPAQIDVVASFPTLVSGKVDRRALPAPRQRDSRQSIAHAPRTPIEIALAETWAHAFGLGAVDIEEHFFLDLGGHSLLAATVVSELRRTPRFAAVSVVDIYHCPTVAQLAAELERRAADSAAAPPAAAPRPNQPAPSWRYWCCAVGQVFGLYLVIGLYALQWLTPYLTYCELAADGYSVIQALTASLASLLVLYPVLLLASVAAKWLFIGRYRAGEYPLWGFYYYRWWLVNQIMGAAPVEFLEGSPLLSVYYRLMGAKVGHNVRFGSDSVSTFDLVSVGDDTSICADTTLSGYSVEGGALILGRVTIGSRCFVGVSSVVRPGAVMEDDTSLGNLSLLPEGTRIPAGECWTGSPARPELPDDAAAAPPERLPRPPRGVRFAYGAMHAAGTFVIPITYLMAIFPGLMLLSWFGRTHPPYGYLCTPLLSPLMGTAFVILLLVEIVVVKRLVLGRVKPGRYPVHSLFYVRKWFIDQLMDLSLDLVGPIYASLYLHPWYTALGAKLGHDAEISTASQTCPDLLEIGDESFVADSVSLGVAPLDRGWITLSNTRIGRRAFLGNSAVVPAGADIGDEVLIGVMSVPPAAREDAMRPNSTWLGSPAVFLPQRQHSTQFGEEETFKPTKALRRRRLLIEFFRIILPVTFFVFISSNLINAIGYLRPYLDDDRILFAVFPFLYTLGGFVAMGISIAFKWLLMGEFVPGEHPLWCDFVWRNELVTAVQEHLAEPFIVDLLQGTPFIAAYFRLMGCKIGRRCYLHTTQFTEHDLVFIGDDVCLNDDCTVQTHLFEDRVMKMSTVRVGDGCSVGANSVLLYDTEMGAGSSLGDVSLLLKGERLPADSRWAGSPARSAD